MECLKRNGRGYGAEANANFAQINGVKATSTADATVKFAAGFQLEESQIKRQFRFDNKICRCFYF